jgi:hypothetical protein
MLKQEGNQVFTRKPPADFSGGEVTNIRKNQFVGEYHLRST